MGLLATKTAAKGAAPVGAVDLTISDVAERMRHATAHDTCKGMFFNGVLSATKVLGGEEALEAVRATLPEKKYVDFFNYPIVTFLPAAFRAAQLLAAGRDFDEAMRRLGEQAIEDFLATPVGRTLVTVSSGEAKRLLRAAPTAYKTAVNYGARETVVLSDTSCIFKVRRDFMPHPYHEGVLLAVLRALGTKDALVRGERLGLLDADYHLSWK
ncbi:MAG: hypothetical protein AMXMBFR34_19010 [Myxococcaceae bacterium]